MVLETVVHLTNFHAEENPIGCAPKLKSGKGADTWGMKRLNVGLIWPMAKLTRWEFKFHAGKKREYHIIRGNVISTRSLLCMLHAYRRGR